MSAFHRCGLSALILAGGNPLLPLILHPQSITISAPRLARCCGSGRSERLHRNSTEHHVSMTAPPTREFVASGQIWQGVPTARRQAVRNVCERLLATYGRPRLGNPRVPLDDLVYLVVSNKTNARTASRVYHALKKHFPSWDMAVGQKHTLRKILAPAGLSSVKSSQLARTFQRIKRDMGECDLRLLRKAPAESAESYLRSLPGVSTKVAKCVMLYTMNSPVLPVDTHVYRIASRLGWTARKRADQCHEELEALVPRAKRLVFHVGCIVLGRTVCLPGQPRCGECCINRYCPSNRDTNG